jgi:hypothetical protein
MKPKAPWHPKSQRLTQRLTLALVVAAGLAAGACERRPRDPKPPSDPGRNVPKPITDTALPALIVLPAAAAGR